MDKVKKIKEWKNGAKAHQFYIGSSGNPTRINDGAVFPLYKHYVADGYVNGTIIYLYSFDLDMIHVNYALCREGRIVSESTVEINSLGLVTENIIYVMPPEPTGG